MEIKRCGACYFGKIIPQDFTKRLCHGAPPSAVQIPVTGGKLTLQMARPVVSVSDEACALYREKDQMGEVRDLDTMRVLQQMKNETETKQ